MECNCIEKICARFKAEFNTDRAFISRQGWSEVSLTPITRKGEYAKHNRYKAVNWKFCPFCGEKREVKKL